jgi:glycosyltransferase involved in cell wall biosynthesis
MQVARDDTAERIAAALVTIAMPCHNEVELLARSLAALAAQLGGTEDLEVILVDNQSDDPRLSDVVDRYSRVLDLKLRRPPHLEHPYALCRARNLALAEARGDWFWTLDSDCMPNPGFLSTLRERVDGLRPGERRMLTGERIFIDGSGLDEEGVRARNGSLEQAPRVRSAANYGLRRDRRFPALAELPEIEHPWDQMHGGNTVFQTEVAREVGGYDTGFDGNWGYEDDEFAYRMISEGEAVPFYEPGLVVYHQEPTRQPTYDRLEKGKNPNWHRVCALIPGYREYKLAGYARNGVAIRAGV